MGSMGCPLSTLAYAKRTVRVAHRFGAVDRLFGDGEGLGEPPDFGERGGHVSDDDAVVVRLQRPDTPEPRLITDLLPEAGTANRGGD